MLVQITASPVAVAATSRAQPGADSAPAAGAPRDQAQTSAATGGALTSTPVGSAPGDAPASLTRTNQPGEAAQAHEEAVFGQSTHDRLALVLQQQEIRQLKQRDQEVRTHERTHAAIAGAHGGTPQYQYERGPDGVMYAVSGHVSIDISEVPGNPEATLEKARTIQRAALAPADPSGADRAVAAKAASMAAQAMQEISQIEKMLGPMSDVAPGAGGQIDIAV